MPFVLQSSASSVSPFIALRPSLSRLTHCWVQQYAANLQRTGAAGCIGISSCPIGFCSLGICRSGRVATNSPCIIASR